MILLHADKFKEIAEAYQTITKGPPPVPQIRVQQFRPMPRPDLFAQLFGNVPNTQFFGETRIRRPTSNPIATNTSYTSSSIQIINGKIIGDHRREKEWRYQKTNNNT